MAQTDYRIADVDGTELFNFNNATTGVGADWWPDIEDMNVRLVMDSEDYRGVGMSASYNTGYSARSFVIRGSLLDDSTNYNQYRLSSIGANRSVKKIYLAGNWFVYGLIQEVNFTRNTSRQSLWDYQVSIGCYDPFIYYAASGGAPSTDYQIKPVNQTMDATNYIDIDLSQTGANQSFCYIEPFFVLQGGASTSVTTSQTITFEDQDGRTLTISPPANFTNGVDFVICPYFFRESPEGQNLQTVVMYQVTNGTVTPGTHWIYDINPYRQGSTMVASGNDLVRSFGALSRTNDSASSINPAYDYYYPRALDGQEGGGSSGENRISVSSTGTLTDAVIDAQYLHRRL